MNDYSVKSAGKEQTRRFMNERAQALKANPTQRAALPTIEETRRQLEWELVVRHH